MIVEKVYRILTFKFGYAEYDVDEARRVDPSVTIYDSSSKVDGFAAGTIILGTGLRSSPRDVEGKLSWFVTSHGADICVHKEA